MAKITTKDQLRTWLADKPADIAVAIGTRVALRVVPAVCHYVGANPAKHATEIILPIFCCVTGPWFECMWPNRTMPYYSFSSKTDSGPPGQLNTRAAFGASHAAFHACYSRSDASSPADYSVSAAEWANKTSYADANFIWAEITADADVVETGLSSDIVMRRPLWNSDIPEWVSTNWEMLRSSLLDLDENWHVWTDWYEDRLRGANQLESRALIEELELKRIQALSTHSREGPSVVNATIARLEIEYRAKTPPQRTAVIEVQYGDDGKLHRRQNPPPMARDEAQDQRLRDAWAAHSKQLATLERLSPGGNAPALGDAIRHYRASLGATYEEMNVIALGIHGERLAAYAARADMILLEDAASELMSLSATHGLFIRQFGAWLDYVNDASGEPSSEMIEAATQVARSTRDAANIIADDVSIPLNELADAAGENLSTNQDEPPLIVKRELLRSIGNVLSGLFAPLVDYVRDQGCAIRRGILAGTENFANQATQAIAIGGTTWVTALALGFPGELGWIFPVLALLKMQLKK